MQVTQYLAEVRTDLHQLVRLAEAQEDALVQLQILSDIRCNIENIFFSIFLQKYTE
jgi:hypothetical protein